jgi:hypothetical protein
MPETNDAEEYGSLEVVQPSALEAIQRAEIDSAISTAKKFPRDVATSIKACRELALRTPEIAATCNYAVPRGGKKLVGPSVHFARIMMSAWGNIRVLTRVIGADRANAHIQGHCHDLQTNTAITFEMDWPVQPPHNDTPERWNDQMNLAKRAGAAVALREAVFNIVPRQLFSGIAEDAKAVAVGDGKSFIDSRNNAIRTVKELGVTQEMIYRFLEVGGIESITTDDLIYLHAVIQSIREGTKTVLEVFGSPAETPVPAQVPRTRRSRHVEPEPADGEQEKEAIENLQTEPEAKVPAAKQEPDPSVDPFPEIPRPEEKKAEKKKTPAPVAAPAAPAPPALSLAGQVRQHLEGTGVTEEQLVGWLDSLGTVPRADIPLDQVNDKWLKMILKEREGTLAQVRRWLEVSA